MELGQKIKNLRAIKGISQETLAKNLKINRNFLSRIETGKSEPTASVLKNIALIFDISIDSLLDLNNEQNTEDKIKYIKSNCNSLNDDDLQFLSRIINIMKEEYVKKK